MSPQVFNGRKMETLKKGSISALVLSAVPEENRAMILSLKQSLYISSRKECSHYGRFCLGGVVQE